MNVRLVPAELWHAAALAPRLRRSDLQELQAVTSESPLAVLIESFDASSMAFCVLEDEEPQILTGAAPISEGVGSIWMLGSDNFKRWPRRFMQLSRFVVDVLHLEYHTLTNFIDERNLASSRWLPRLGFKLGMRIEDYAGSGLPFVQFTSTRPDHV
jgi:hypothetical protein